MTNMFRKCLFNMMREIVGYVDVDNVEQFSRIHCQRLWLHVSSQTFVVVVVHRLYLVYSAFCRRLLNRKCIISNWPATRLRFERKHPEHALELN